MSCHDNKVNGVLACIVKDSLRSRLRSNRRMSDKHFTFKLLAAVVQIFQGLCFLLSLLLDKRDRWLVAGSDYHRYR